MKDYNTQESLKILKTTDLFEGTLILKFKLNKNGFLWEGVILNWDLEKGQREFIQIYFCNVKMFSRKIPKIKNNRFIDVFDNFYLDDFTGAYESEYSHIQILENNDYQITITMPYLLGSISFSFGGLKLKRKIGYGKQVETNKWVYHDIDTGDVFDFNNPFKTLKLLGK